MGLEVNRHVERLTGYLPFDADTSQLFHEYVEPSTDVLTTKAFEYLAELVDRPSCRLVVLTGDAGHGKTHLCFRLLVARGSTPDDAQELIRTVADGSVDLGVNTSGRPIRIIKDLSEFTTDASALLLDALATEDRVTVVCANEGRLRKAIQDGGPGLDLIRRTIEEGVATGSTTLDGETFVVNLNYQSVASSEGESLTLQLLRSWARDQRKWRSCASCDAQVICPIYENHRLLGIAPEAADRRANIDSVLRLVERAGTVATIRELLIAGSLAITGGLRCADVHRRFERGRSSREWQHPHLFHQALYGSTLTNRERSRVRLLDGLARQDPASVAVRQVDDSLVPDEDERTGWFLPPLPAPDEPSARTRSQSRKDAQRQHQLIAFLRRRSLFNEERTSPEHGTSIGERSGFVHAALFETAAENILPSQERIRLRDRLISGLEAVQGVRRPPQANFFIVDPAFTSHRSSASVVARQLPAASVDFLSQAEWWATQSSGELRRAVDWSHRAIVVSIVNGDSAAIRIELDLPRFELVLRYADGLIARDHFHADLRRLSSRLAQLATTSETGEITVLVRGERRKLSIDIGDRVRALDA